MTVAGLKGISHTSFVVAPETQRCYVQRWHALFRCNGIVVNNTNTNDVRTFTWDESIVSGRMRVYWELKPRIVTHARLLGI